MITVKETTERTLDGPEAISAYLRGAYEGMATKSRFEAGQIVHLTSRSGISPDVAIGDVAVALFDIPDQPWTFVLCLIRTGMPIAVQVPTENLSLTPPAIEN